MNEQRIVARPPVEFGSFRRLTPISRLWGSDRGQPIDRRYIENFLKRHAGDMRGRVLEFHGNSYTRLLGGSRVTKSDVLNVEEGNPKSTFVGDLATAHHLPTDAFDCIIMTQVLQFVYDLHGAIFTLHRILKPGGVLLATMPGIIPIHPEEWPFYWSMTATAVTRLFNERFPASAIEIEPHGNVLAAISLLQGLASEELETAELDHEDPSYPVVIAVRVVKPAGQ
jgi:SAM-dependent methyltransferase